TSTRGERESPGGSRASIGGVEALLLALRVLRHDVRSGTVKVRPHGVIRLSEEGRERTCVDELVRPGIEHPGPGDVARPGLSFAGSLFLQKIDHRTDEWPLLRIARLVL